MSRTIIQGGKLVTSAGVAIADIAIEGEKIVEIGSFKQTKGCNVIDARGALVFAGGIDPHVHFREPGLTHKADIESESRAAILGGVTSYYDMPNTAPATVTIDAVRGKIVSAMGRSYANYGFNLGITNENIDHVEEAIKSYPSLFGGVKAFLGSSTGNMLVDNVFTLQKIFKLKGKPIMLHCEDEQTIQNGIAAAKKQYGEDIPFSAHPQIRSDEACFKSTVVALSFVTEDHPRVHICHVSTSSEASIIAMMKQKEPQITCETSINYLWFCSEDYEKLGAKIKCNPAIKTRQDRDYLRARVLDGTIDLIASDHAPHLESEKQGKYLETPSGIPSIQFTLPALIDLFGRSGESGLRTVARVFSENAARLMGLEQRGKIAEGCYADLVVLRPGKPTVVTKEIIESKCGWSPYEGTRFSSSVETVLVNGSVAVRNGEIVNRPYGKRL